MPSPWSTESGTSSYSASLRLERVVDLLGREPLVAAAVGHRERLHQLPAGVVRRRQVAHLPRRDQRVERGQGLLEPGLPVPLVHVVDVDVVGAEPAQAGLAAGDDVLPGQARVVRPVAHRHPHLGRQQQRVPAPVDHLPGDLLREPARVDVGRVDQVHPGVQAHVNVTAGRHHVGRAHRAEPAAPAERHRAKRQRRYAQPAAAQLSVLHRRHSTLRLPRPIAQTNICRTPVRASGRPAPSRATESRRDWAEPRSVRDDELEFDLWWRAFARGYFGGTSLWACQSCTSG